MGWIDLRFLCSFAATIRVYAVTHAFHTSESFYRCIFPNFLNDLLILIITLQENLIILDFASFLVILFLSSLCMLCLCREDDNDFLTQLCRTTGKLLKVFFLAINSML